MNPDISAVIPVHGRPDLLRKTINSLIEQTYPKDNYEIIIVDNSQGDEIRQVVDDVCAQKKYPLRYTRELIPGANRARNAGIRIAKGEIIACTDSDVVADENWLCSLASAYSDPAVGGTGGKILPIWPASRPSWLTPKMEQLLAILDLGPARFMMDRYPVGANMSFRRSLWETAGGFDEPGRSADNLLSNDEDGLFERIMASGVKVMYVPEAVTYHHIHAARLSRSWFMRRFYWEGKSRTLVSNLSKPDNKRQLFVNGLDGMYETGKGLLRLIGKRVINKHPQTLEDVLWLCYIWGSAIQRFQLSMSHRV